MFLCIKTVSAVPEPVFRLVCDGDGGAGRGPAPPFCPVWPVGPLGARVTRLGGSTGIAVSRTTPDAGGWLLDALLGSLVVMSCKANASQVGSGCGCRAGRGLLISQERSSSLTLRVLVASVLLFERHRLEPPPGFRRPGGTFFGLAARRHELDTRYRTLQPASRPEARLTQSCPEKCRLSAGRPGYPSLVTPPPGEF